VRLKRGETAASLAALERAVELMPRSASVRFHLGMAQMQAGQMVKAKTSLKEALATNQKFSERDNAQAALAALEKKAG
jgi:Tfp pilus assembly protein PilF